ncbi:MAG: oligosaccharide flippase family protein [Planctomycetota bacterium]
MIQTPRVEGATADPALGSSAEAEVDLAPRVAGASAWAFGAMGGIHALKAGSQIVLAYLLAREYWGVIAILQVLLTAVEMLSDVGIRGAVVYHRAGTSRSFLNTAWTAQIARGVILWLACCALAWPAAWYYERPLLLVLLPVCGLESVNNGLLSVGVYSRQRTMRVGMPIVLDWIGLGVSIAASIAWALVDPSPWALAIGPLVGGVVKTTASHVLIPEVRLRLQWDRDAARDLIHFGKWIYAGTVAAFVAQQFLTLYLGKMVVDSILGLYWVAWGFSVQATKPLTLISNQVLIPLFAQGGRLGPREHQARIEGAMHRYLPACLLIVLGVAFVCPAFFHLLYREEYHEAGNIGRWIGVVLWFMILQHVPRSAMLSLGDSRGTCLMMVANGAVTVASCIAGYLFGAGLGVGALRGAILGNALGNVAGCVAGAASAHRTGMKVGGPMTRYSAAFLALFALGVWLDGLLPRLHAAFTPVVSSVLVTAVLLAPLALVVWRRTIRIALAQRRAAKAPATAP